MLNREQQLILIDLAYASIKNGLVNASALQVNPGEYPLPLQQIQACFVTLTIKSALRGCIGHLEASQSVVEEVAEDAYSAAFGDPRFPKLANTEFEQIDLHISLLTKPDPLEVLSEADLLNQLRPGIDGLILKQGYRQATFLPSVWEQLTTPKEFVEHLKIKGRFPADYWSDEVEVFRYQTESIQR